MQSNMDYERPIDNQEKLAYYNASYIQKKIEETNQALLETDENGRFKSVRFDNDSVIYSLNTETVTDDDAYQDAMNEYNYKVQLYEKEIADINAKTSIIQEEDRTLELRLKQLDTEQNALATELDAVKKVIKDNVDKTFKTFSD
jgi:predicted RNase H-like nuclease (RuvC/YqgF family)